MLLTAILVASLFSVSLTAKTGGGRNDRRIVANSGAKALSQQLQQFVTGDVTNASAGTIAGPGSGTGGWQLTGSLSANAAVSCPAGCTACSGTTVTDTCPDSTTSCYALNPGTHTLTNYLPVWFECPPYGARIKYFVASASTIPAVNISVSWTEP